MRLNFLCALVVAGGAILATRPAVFAQAAAPVATAPAVSPLDDYVAAADDTFAWRVLSKQAHEDRTELVLEMTSQRWRDDDEVSRGVWRHGITLVIPHSAQSDAALLYIAGGSNNDPPPNAASNQIREAALASRSVAAMLTCVPNQPTIVYGSDAPHRDRYEDDLLAATWNRFAATEDPTWLAQLAMAKSAVRAMDAVQAAVAEVDGAPAIKRFTVAGASKRGWTTWLTAIVDKRVAAIAPIVIDMLNIGPSMRHHRACYGAWSRALKDYEKQGIADKLDQPEGQAILSIVDPYAYRSRLSLPKVMVNAAGDEFFLPDSSRFYYDDLIGEKHLSYTPNTGHSLRGTDALETVIALHASVAHGLTRPTVTWTGDSTGAEHVVTCSAKPIEAVLWRAVNPAGRDFRHALIGAAYESRPLEADGSGTYRIAIEPPAEGYSATFARFTFDIGAGVPWRISTPVWVAPDVEPFAGGE
ncbi:PhoPQ-activated pathogenicity-related family protein [Botrimarina hoheduenensis]|uniref:PhoPQ-activated pathogenicity-related protein n=1 Tax=Botrimarina hoheduenensis TaxID=2528000 RepID=A0A5C5VXN8_9BACT|nr:PhoPQ-activated protein PqaA family protein [Botrimarina hoheduenensis]TWT43408.1 PhoPQ-activated pathogenicity-related protein [Botrimarina hoheduenensis]